METTTCNICHASDARVKFHLTDLLLKREGVRYTLVECPVCGLVYQNPRPTLEEMGDHYPDEYESYNPDPGQESGSWLLRRAIRYGIEKRCRFITRRKRSGALLDVGCATGVFLRGMRRPGWKVQGVEISPHAAQIARERYGLDVFSGTLEAAAFPSGAFDAVTLWDVLEHLHDPSAGLAEIHRVLKPDGILVFRVPNGKSWDARLFGRYWAGLDAPRHLYVFDRRTLTQLLETQGFKVQAMSCGIGSYPTFVLSVRLWLQGKGTGLARQEKIARLLYHPIARLVTAPFFYLGNQGLRGPLLTVTAAKN